MKKFLALLLLLMPVVAFAGTREIDMWSDFQNLTQPKPSYSIVQTNISARYIADEKTLTDKIVYTSWKKTWSTKGPWSLASPSFRKSVQNCKKTHINFTASSCGFYNYQIIRISPSGTYIELQGNGYESSMWRMLDTKTGKIILSNDNGVVKSMWTADKKQFIWKTDTCDIGGCQDPSWTFITTLNKFPKYTRVK